MLACKPSFDGLALNERLGKDGHGTDIMPKFTIKRGSSELAFADPEKLHDAADQVYLRTCPQRGGLEEYSV